jgi:type VI secretion system secreted protein VgrG
MHNLELSFPGRDEVLSVRGYRVEEAISTPFAVSLTARSEHEDLDIDTLAGSEAAFSIAIGDELRRVWTGVCSHAEVVQAEASGLSTYALTLVPDLWLLTQRTNCRVLRRLTAPQVALAILREWGIDPELRLEADAYPVLDFRVQYGETDFAFVSRTLEEAGVAYLFEVADGRTRLVLVDRPTQGEVLGEPIPFHADVTSAGGRPYATALHRATHVRTGAYRLRDYDFLRPSFDLRGEAAPRAPDARLSRYEYLPGASLGVVPVRAGGDSQAPATGVREGALQNLAEQRLLAAAAQRRLEAVAADRRVLGFATNVLGVSPGAIVTISGHPRSDIAADTRLLVTSTSLEGTAEGERRLQVGAVFASVAYRPPLRTPRPRITGVQSAVVVGLPGEEIHVDEHGRIRVLFAWDQEGERGDRSSCWVRVSQSWAGAGFGVVAIPRIGDEVLVTFFDGDPDQPVVVGRLHNATHLHPFRLPREKTLTGIRTRSSRGGLGHNELAFEDRTGFEAIRLHAHKDLVEDVLNDHHTTVHRDDVTRVHGDLSLRVEGTQAVSIGKNALVAVQGDRTEVVFGTATENHEGASELHAAGDRGERFDAGYRLTVAGRTRVAYRDGKEELVSGAAVTRVVGDASALYTGSRRQEVLGPAFAVFGDTIHVTAAHGASVAAGHGASQGHLEITEEGATRVTAPSVTVNAAGEITLAVGSSRVVISDKKITFDAETIQIAARKEVALTTDHASTVWTDQILAKAQTIRAASNNGASLELSDKAKLDGTKISLGESASVEKQAFERRKAQLPIAPKTRVTLRDLAGKLISGAEYEVSVPGYTDRGTAGGGTVEVPVFDDVESCVVRWGRPLSAREPGASQATFEFQSTIFLRVDVPGDADETARRKLRNLGHHHEALHAAKDAFARRAGVASDDEGTLAASIDSEHGS